MSEPRRRKKIEQIPLRVDLPEEIAALAVPSDEEGDETVILNASEQPSRAWADLRFGAIILAAVGWLAEQSRRWVLDHKAIAMSVGATATVTAGAIVGIDTMLDGNGTSLAQPSPTVTIVATATVTEPGLGPRPTVTRTAPPSLITRPTEGEPTSGTEPSRTRPATAGSEPTSEPEPSAEPEPSQQTSAPLPREPTPDTPADQPNLAPDSPAPEPTATASPEPTVTTAARDCVLGVDLDPILDVCILS